MAELKVILAGGVDPEIVEDERFANAEGVEEFLRSEVRSPRWVRIGNLNSFSQNIIGVRNVA